MSNPSFLAISDVHLGLNLYNNPELGSDLPRLFTQACKTAIDLGVDYLVVAGDLYDSNKPTPDMLRFVRTQVEEARMGEVRVLGIAGDHDKPVNSESWIRLSGILPIDTVPEFIGHDYDDDPTRVMDYIKSGVNRDTAQWIFLHGQVPTLWPFCSELKRLDLNSLPIFDIYPKLKGAILGDIHKPYEGKITQGNNTAYVGYCGSLGVTASSDIGEHKGLLHFDGKTLKRVPFPLGRDFVKVDLSTGMIAGMEIGYYVEKYKKHRGLRPIFLVEYTQTTKDRLAEIKPLYQLGFVRTFQQRKPDASNNKQQSVSIRSDLNNADRMAAVLADLVPDEEVRTLLQTTLSSEDPKLLLDAFRRKYVG